MAFLKPIIFGDIGPPFISPDFFTEKFTIIYVVV